MNYLNMTIMTKVPLPVTERKPPSSLRVIARFGSIYFGSLILTDISSWRGQPSDYFRKKSTSLITISTLLRSSKADMSYGRSKYSYIVSFSPSNSSGVQVNLTELSVYPSTTATKTLHRSTDDPSRGLFRFWISWVALRGSENFMTTFPVKLADIATALVLAVSTYSNSVFSSLSSILGP